MAEFRLQGLNGTGKKKKKKKIIPDDLSKFALDATKPLNVQPTGSKVADTPDVDVPEAVALTDADRLKEALIQQDVVDTEVPQVEEIAEPPVEEVVAAPVVTPPTGPTSADLFKQQQNAATNAALAQLKQRISESVAGQRRVIDTASQQFDPLRSQSEVDKSQQLRSALERASLRGDRGGIGRSEALATQTAGENRLNQINLAEQNVIDQANAEIQRLENEGRFEEARIREQSAANELAFLLEEKRVEEQRQFERGVLEEQRAFDATRREEEQRRSDFLNTLGRFGGDFAAEIQMVENDGDPSNDWRIPFLQQARREKIVGQEEAAAAAAEAARATGVGVGGGGSGLTAAQLATNARSKVSRGIPLTAEEALVYGVDEGYVDPAFAESVAGTDAEFATDLLENEIENFVKGTNDIGFAAASWLVQNMDAMTEDQFESIKLKYRLTDDDLEDAYQKIYRISPSVGN